MTTVTGIISTYDPDLVRGRIVTRDGRVRVFQREHLASIDTGAFEAGDVVLFDMLRDDAADPDAGSIRLRRAEMEYAKSAPQLVAPPSQQQTRHMIDHDDPQSSAKAAISDKEREVALLREEFALRKEIAAAGSGTKKPKKKMSRLSLALSIIAFGAFYYIFLMYEIVGFG